MMKKMLMGVALIGLLGQAHAADQQTNQSTPPTTSGKLGVVDCYIMVPDKNGKWKPETVQIHGKNTGGGLKECSAVSPN